MIAPWGYTSVKFVSWYNNFSCKKMYLKMSSAELFPTISITGPSVLRSCRSQPHRKQGTHFTTRLLAHNPNLVKMPFNHVQWRHNERDGASNHRHLDCLPNRLFRRRSETKLKLCVTGLCEGNQIKIILLPTISHLQLPNFVSCGRACPSHMTQNLVTVGAKLWTAERFLVDPWSTDYADPVW